MGATWGGGWDPTASPTPAVPTAPPGYRFREPERYEYARWGSRLGGVLIDGLVLGFANGVINFLGNLGGIALGNSIKDCETVQTFRGTFQRCSGSVGAYWFVVGLATVISVAVWWRLVPSRMSRRGATIGMGACGIRIVTAEGHFPVSRGQAFLRVIYQGLLPILLVIPVVVLLVAGSSVAVSDWDRVDSLAEAFDPLWPWLSLAVFGYLLSTMSTLWHFVDRRYQTLYDKLAGTVVLRAR